MPDKVDVKFFNLARARTRSDGGAGDRGPKAEGGHDIAAHRQFNVGRDVTENLETNGLLFWPLRA